MKAPLRPYTRLPGRSWSLFGTSSLWLATDHLLLLRMRGYTEVYRRFYFGDIQAFAVQHTRGVVAWAVGLGIPAVLAMVAVLANAPPGWGFWAFVAAPFVVPLVVHLARGATCRCTVSTALETTELVALGRVRSARKSLAILRAEVEKVQGQAQIAEPQAESSAAPAAAGPAGAAAGAAAPPFLPLPASGPPPLPSAHPVRWHRALIALLASDAMVSAAQGMAEVLWLDALAIFLAAAETAVALAAIVAQNRSGIGRRALRRFPWVSIAFIATVLSIAWVAGMVITLQQAAAGTPPPSPFFAVPTFGPRLPALQIASVFGYLGLAVWGRLALRGSAPARQPAP